MSRRRPRGYAWHCLAFALAFTACDDGGQNAGSADAGSGAQSAGSGGSLGSGGKGAAGNGSGGTGGRDFVCPPCAAPPAPGCIGSGPCGCGPYTCPGDPGAADAGAADAGAANADAGPCPAFDDAFVATLKSCKVSDDCQVIQQQIDCCGTSAAMGIAKASSARFFQCAPASSSFPSCDCATRPTQADDGRSNASFDLNDVGVRCREGACSSYLQTRKCGTLTCTNGELCVAYEIEIGPPDIEHTCKGNPCSGKLDCECAQALCDLRPNAQRTCGVDSMTDVLCSDPH